MKDEEEKRSEFSFCGDNGGWCGMIDVGKGFLCADDLSYLLLVR